MAQCSHNGCTYRGCRWMTPAGRDEINRAHAAALRMVCQHRTTRECCNGWDERCLDCGKLHV